jgi:hypothetical protein
MKELYDLGRCFSLQVVMRKIDQIFHKSFGSGLVYQKSTLDTSIDDGHFEHEAPRFLSGMIRPDDSKSGQGYRECEDVDVERIIRGVLNAKLQGHKLTDLYGYLNKTIRSQISESLRARGIPLRKGKCGTCKYFPDSRPRICQLEELLDNEVSSAELTPNPFFGIERKWDDPSCPGYQNRKAPFKPIGDQKDGNRATDKSIKDGEDEHRKTEARLDMYHLFSMLKDCYEQAETAKQKEIYAVISEDIGFIYEKLRDGCSFEEGRSSLLDFKISSQKQRGNYSKMLRRNLKRVEECLDQKKMSE